MATVTTAADIAKTSMATDAGRKRFRELLIWWTEECGYSGPVFGILSRALDHIEELEVNRKALASALNGGVKLVNEMRTQRRALATWIVKLHRGQYIDGCCQACGCELSEPGMDVPIAETHESQCPVPWAQGLLEETTEEETTK